MDFKKLITISLKDVRITFGDRNLLLIMILAPLALTFIIGAAFSKFIGGTNDLPVEKPKIAIVNEDTGVTFPGQPKLSFGDILTGLLIPSKDNPIPLDSQKMSRADAIAQVDKGKLDAAVLIPANFSSALNPANAQLGETKVTYYRNAGSSIEATVGESIVRGALNGVLSGDIADLVAGHEASINSTQNQADFQRTIAENVGRTLQSNPPIQLNSVSITGQSAAQQTFDPLQYFAPSMAVFFLTFTMAGGVVGIIEERDKGTLQRMLSSPTSRITILAGKFGGTYLNGLGQLTVLIIATSFIAPVLGSTHTVWGNNIPGIILITLSAVAAAVGLGTLIAGIAKTAQQADTISNAVLILAGILGGSFFNIAQSGGFLQNASKLTLNYWATNAYSTLAQSGDISAILPNIAALLTMFVVFFGIGVVLFNRRLDV